MTDHSRTNIARHELCRDNHNMKLDELCCKNNAYFTTNYSRNNIVRQEKFVVTWKTLSRQ